MKLKPIVNIVRYFTSYSDYFIELFISSFQEKGGVDTFTHGPLALKYKLDNEFELLFVVSFLCIMSMTDYQTCLRIQCMI